MDHLAVLGTNVIKSYNKGKVLAVNNLDIQIPTGTIYGLLGASGCGKTTLLRCILGRLTPENGTIMVFGHPSSSPESNIPGCGVGYVPQELALYGEFSISEHLRFFGWLHGMEKKDVEKQKTYLIDLLELPNTNRPVKKMSGGQKRRVSLAVALLHQPPLLILDEPTVGLDPLLRMKIWQHLTEVSTQNGTTVIVTTHYIEEATRANLVGLMRDGRILAEAPPDFLLSKYASKTLEEVFLQLCLRVENSSRRTSPIDRSVSLEMQKSKSISSKSVGKEKSDMSEKTPLLTSRGIIKNKRPVKEKKLHIGTIFFTNVAALMWKNLLKLARNPGEVLFDFFLPSLQISLFCLAIGRNPSGLSLATVNLDRGYAYGKFQNISLGRVLLDCIDSDDIRQVEYASIREARQKAHSNKVKGVFLIPENFTVDTELRINDCLDVSKATIEGSTVSINLDITDLQIVRVISNTLENAYECFIDKVSTTSIERFNPSSLKNPVHFSKPYYGKRTDSYLNFLAPGVLSSSAYALPVALTALALVLERKEGLLERMWVAGVTAGQQVFGHFFTQVFVLVVQVLLVVFFTLVVFDIRCDGSVLLLLSLLFLQGIGGMSLGLVISSLCENEQTAIQLSVGIFIPIMTLSGVLWPLEAMPTWLQVTGNLLPVAKAAKAARSIAQRGWGMSWRAVWEGHLVPIVWIVFLLAFAIISLKKRR